jgi:hypothetical protein
MEGKGNTDDHSGGSAAVAEEASRAAMPALETADGKTAAAPRTRASRRSNEELMAIPTQIPRADVARERRQRREKEQAEEQRAKESAEVAQREEKRAKESAETAQEEQGRAEESAGDGLQSQEDGTDKEDNMTSEHEERTPRQLGGSEPALGAKQEDPTGKDVSDQPEASYERLLRLVQATQGPSGPGPTEDVRTEAKGKAETDAKTEAERRTEALAGAKAEEEERRTTRMEEVDRDAAEAKTKSAANALYDYRRGGLRNPSPGCYSPTDGSPKCWYETPLERRRRAIRQDRERRWQAEQDSREADEDRRHTARTDKRRAEQKLQDEARMGRFTLPTAEKSEQQGREQDGAGSDRYHTPTSGRRLARPGHCCYNCGRFGHDLHDCTFPRRERRDDEDGQGSAGVADGSGLRETLSRGRDAAPDADAKEDDGREAPPPEDGSDTSGRSGGPFVLAYEGARALEGAASGAAVAGRVLGTQQAGTGGKRIYGGGREQGGDNRRCGQAQPTQTQTAHAAPAALTSAPVAGSGAAGGRGGDSGDESDGSRRRPAAGGRAATPHPTRKDVKKDAKVEAKGKAEERAGGAKGEGKVRAEARGRASEARGGDRGRAKREARHETDDENELSTEKCKRCGEVLEVCTCPMPRIRTTRDECTQCRRWIEDCDCPCTRCRKPWRWCICNDETNHPYGHYRPPRDERPRRTSPEKPRNKGTSAGGGDAGVERARGRWRAGPCRSTAPGGRGRQEAGGREEVRALAAGEDESDARQLHGLRLDY